MKSLGLFLTVLVWTGVFQQVKASGWIDVQFINFWSNGRDAGGGCCDLICSNPCDPYFHICIGLNNRCDFFNRKSNAYHEQNSVTFGRGINGIGNPITMKRSVLPDQFTVKVSVTDTDPNSGDDYMGQLSTSFRVQEVSTNGTKGQYTLRTLSNSNGIGMKINIRVYCDMYYYGDRCNVYCKEDLEGHYSCNSTSGEKICNKGWTGPKCDEDVNECRLNVMCPNDTNCTEDELNCNGCFLNGLCHNETNCTTFADDIICDGCFLSDLCYEGANCTEVFDAMDRSCNNETNCTDTDIICDGCSVLGVCNNGTNCTDIVRKPQCDGCLLAGFCHEGTNCSAIDYDPECDGCKIETVCQQSDKCTNFPGGFTCTCLEGFKGDICNETVHECVMNPCLFDGACTGNETSYTCDCLPWRAGDICETEVDTCEAEPCFNNATCISNNITLPGYTCECESDWAGPTCEYMYGDPHNVTLSGVINDQNLKELTDGLVSLITGLGEVKGKVYVKVESTDSTTQNGDTVTTIIYRAAGENAPIPIDVYDRIFEVYTDERINSYLPLPIYHPTKQIPIVVPAKNTWINIVIGVVVAVVLLIILILVIFFSRKYWSRKVIFVRSESVVSNKSETIGIENPLYHRHTDVRESDVITDEDITFTVDQDDQTTVLPVRADLDPIYTDPLPEMSHYDTPVKQLATAPDLCDSELTGLDTRCKAGVNPYTDFGALDGTREECPYSELDEITAQKVANTVGSPDAMSQISLSVDEEDDEDDIDKIKASFKEWHSEA